MDIRMLLPMVIAFIVVTVTLSVGLDVLTEVRDNYGNATAASSGSDSWAYNNSLDALSGGDNISSWLPTIGIVLGASVVIGVLITYFGRGGA